MNETTITASFGLADKDPVTGTNLRPFDPSSPNRRLASIHMAEGDAYIHAFTPEALEDVGYAMLELAGEMRADRTAHEQDEARKEAAINRTTAALDRFVRGDAARNDYYAELDSVSGSEAMSR